MALKARRSGWEPTLSLKEPAFEPGAAVGAHDLFEFGDRDRKRVFASQRNDAFEELRLVLRRCEFPHEVRVLDHDAAELVERCGTGHATR